MPGARIAGGDRVTLRTVEREDVEFLQRASADPELRYPLGNPVRNREEFDVPDEDAGADRFLVCLEADDTDPGPPDADEVTPVGQVSVADADYKRPELGYWLVPEVHGEGYGTEAVSLVLDYVFREYDVPAVGAAAFDFNDASRGLLESLGFAEEGRMRAYMFVDGEHRDMVQYGLLREEWRSRDPDRA
ncbi:GNAT family N-acetyltransferase [Halorussus sp. AFM4]|uniref:GNAT family N-acetyltransferase n=1 Tax=Halorussus sp. AFM4 TaxID=3421651 RepID=UPI003EBAC48C